MKLKNILIAIFTGTALLLNGCSKVDDFLDADPSKSTKKVIQTAEQLDQIFDPWAFLQRKDAIFERLKDLEF